jgi:hypothetical protein
MSNIEFQMDAASFLGAQRNALRNLGLCPPLLPAVMGVQIVIDHIEIGNNSLRHNQYTEFPVFYEELGEKVPTKNICAGFQTQLAQQVTVYLTTQNDILAHPNGPPALLVPFSATLVFDLDFYALDDDCYLRATLNAVEPGPLPLLPSGFNPLTTLPKEIQDQITQYLTQQARPFFPSPAMPMGLGDLAKGAGFMNAGLSVDTQMQRIALRAQIGGSQPNLDVPWSNFFSGFFPDRLQGSDWGLFVEAGLLTETIKALVYQNLPRDDNLQAFPGCTYSNAGGQAVLNIDVLLIYHLYRNLDIDIDISAEADPTVGIELSIDSPDWLTINFDFTQLLNSNDPLVNLALDLARIMGIPIEAILYQLVGSAALAELPKAGLENCRQPSPGHVQCDKHIRIPQFPGTLQTTMNRMLALDDGICVAGSINVRELTPAAIQTSIQEFKEGAPSVTCGPAGIVLVAAFQQDPSAFTVLHARAFIQNQGTSPLNLCSPPLVLRGGNGTGPFPQRAIRTDAQQAPIDIFVDISAPAQDYYDAPYPLDLLVRTSGGTRLVRFNPPPRVSQQDYSRLAAELLAKIADCEKLVDPWFFHHQGYNPHWSPRPPEEGAVVQHLWQVVVSGLPAGEVAGLVDSGNRELVTAVGTGSPMRLSAMVAPGGERELSIMHLHQRGRLHARKIDTADELAQTAASAPASAGRGIASGAGERQRGLEVRQTLLIQQGSIALPRPAKKLILTNLLGGQYLIAVLDERIFAFDFGIPHRPVLARSWQVEGVRGVLNWKDSLLVFGREGLDWIDRSGRRDAFPAGCGPAPVLDAAASRQELYALTAESLEIYSGRLCRLKTIPLAGGCSIVRVGSSLVVGGEQRLNVIEWGDNCRTQNETFIGDGKISAVKPVLAGEAGSFVTEMEDGTARIFRLHQGCPEEIARYSEMPWFLGSVRLGDLLIKIGTDRMSLDVYRFGESKVL